MLANDVPLVVIGDGPDKNKLMLLACQLGIEHRVFFLGQVSDQALKYHFHACYAFVFPSTIENEAFGLVQLEAMICGKPIINTQLNSGVPWVARHDREAITVMPGDECALAKAIDKLLSDSHYANCLGDAGRVRVETEYSRHRFVETSQALYLDVSRNT